MHTCVRNKEAKKQGAKTGVLGAGGRKGITREKCVR